MSTASDSNGKSPKSGSQTDGQTYCPKSLVAIVRLKLVGWLVNTLSVQDRLVVFNRRSVCPKWVLIQWTCELWCLNLSIVSVITCKHFITGDGLVQLKWLRNVVNLCKLCYVWLIELLCLTCRIIHSFMACLNFSIYLFINAWRAFNVAFRHLWLTI